MSITVHFTGICTHLPAVGESAHRVILVRADNGAYINGASIPPHIPVLKIAPRHIARIKGELDGLAEAGSGKWRICGVHFTLLGMDDHSLERDATFAQIPHLSVDGDDMPLVSKEVLGKEQAACYIDLFQGRLSSTQTKHKAIMSKLTIEPGADPVLNVRCFWNRKESQIHLKPDAVIEVEHVGTQDGDTEKDFLFHYRVFEWVHSKAVVPPEPTKKRMRAPGNVSIGCSNSQYP